MQGSTPNVVPGGIGILMQHILTSLLCPHSHFFTKVSNSILVCCSHRHIVGRVGYQTRNVIRQFHPSINSDCFIEHVIHIIRSAHSSVLHLISGLTVAMSCHGAQERASHTNCPGFAGWLCYALLFTNIIQIYTIPCFETLYGLALNNNQW